MLPHSLPIRLLNLSKGYDDDVVVVVVVVVGGLG